MLPNFICPGTQKAATSTLYLLLKQHPDVFIPEEKETHFFDSQFDKGISWYENMYYKNAEGYRVVGDITPEYMVEEDVAEKLYHHLGGDVKIIFMLRNPIKRAYSHYWMNRNRGFETDSFQKVVYNWVNNKEEINYIERGFYAKQIKQYMKYFSVENMKFIIFEDFVSNVEDQITEITKFLEIDEQFEFDYNVSINYSSGKPKYPIVVELVKRLNLAKVGSKIIPMKMQPKVKNLLRDTILKQSKTKNKVPKIDDETFIKLKEIYKDDINDLKEITGLELYKWADCI